MNIEQVKLLSTQDRFLYFVNERESIRRKKELGVPRPWTDNEILNTYRFCNVRRMDDKVSKWLMVKWYKPYKDHHNMVYACALARFFNLPSSLVRITGDVFREGEPDWEQIKTTMRESKKLGPVFNGAYLVSANGGGEKIGTVVDVFVQGLRGVEVVSESMEQTWKNLCERRGFASFSSGQVVADLRWALTGMWKDKSTWAPLGPGSSRGLTRLLHGDSWQSVAKIRNQDDFLKGLTDLIKLCKKFLSTDITKRLDAHDYQNCLCEFDKMERTLRGEGRPKQLYKENF